MKMSAKNNAELKLYPLTTQEGLSDEFIRRLPSLPKEMARSSGLNCVAMMYFPDISPRSASRALRREIETYPALKKALEAANWTPRRRILTPLQSQILLFYLGEPA